MKPLLFTTRIRRMEEGNSFRVLVCPQGGRGGTYPGLVQGTYPLPPAKVPTPPIRSGWREGVPQGTYPHPPARSGWGVPQGTYTPPPHQVLATRRVVCLLRSRRRTFLLLPAYVVRWEGNSFTLSVHTGGRGGPGTPPGGT